MRSRAILAALAAALLCAGCYPPPRATPPGPALRCGASCTDSVGITYLGVGGFLIRHGGDAVLTPPFFSKPGPFLAALPLPSRANERKIDAGWERLRLDTTGIRAMLVGHSHYDHLMDVPRIAGHWLPRVPVWGNDAMLNLLAADPVRARLHSAEDSVTRRDDPARRWIYPDPARRTVRFLALRGEHAPHFLGLKLYRAAQDSARPNLPENTWQWAEGQPLGFVIEFLDEESGEPVFRVHYQDAASTPPLGFPPQGLGRYDVAVICAGAFDQVKLYPDSLLRTLRPRQAVVGHWEDFFTWGLVGAIPNTDVWKLAWRIDRALPGPDRRRQPAPGDTQWYCVCAPEERPYDAP